MALPRATARSIAAGMDLFVADAAAVIGTAVDTTCPPAQSGLLNQVSAPIDAGAVRTTTTSNTGTIDAAHLKQVHALVESSRRSARPALAGF